jgi:hypothetical protein
MTIVRPYIRMIIRIFVKPSQPGVTASIIPWQRGGDLYPGAAPEAPAGTRGPAAKKISARHLPDAR